MKMRKAKLYLSLARELCVKLGPKALTLARIRSSSMPEARLLRRLKVEIIWNSCGRALRKVERKWMSRGIPS